MLSQTLHPWGLVCSQGRKIVAQLAPSAPAAALQLQRSPSISLITWILLTRTYNLMLHSLTLPPPAHCVGQYTFSSIYTLLTESLQQNLRVRDRKTFLCLFLLSSQSVYLLCGVLISFSTLRICLLESSPVWHAYTLLIFTKNYILGNHMKHSLTLILQEHVADAHQLAWVAWWKIYCDWNRKKFFVIVSYEN